MRRRGERDLRRRVRVHRHQRDLAHRAEKAARARRAAAWRRLVGSAAVRGLAQAISTRWSEGGNAAPGAAKG